MADDSLDNALFEYEERVRMSAAEASADSKFSAVEAALEKAEAVGKIDPLTSQQRQMIAYVRAGFPPHHAAAAVGMTITEATHFVKTNRAARVAMEYLVSIYTAQIQVNIHTLTMQAYEERARAATAAEGLRALEFIAKLHGIGGYAQDNKGKKKGGAVINQNGDVESGIPAAEERKRRNRKQLEMLGDDDLLGGADLGIDSLDPQPVRRGD